MSKQPPGLYTRNIRSSAAQSYAQSSSPKRQPYVYPASPTFTQTRGAQSVFANSPTNRPNPTAQEWALSRPASRSAVAAGASIIQAPVVRPRKTSNSPSAKPVPDNYRDERASSGLGYGTRHPYHFAYLQGKNKWPPSSNEPVAWNTLPLDPENRAAADGCRRFDVMEPTLA